MMCCLESKTALVASESVFTDGFHLTELISEPTLTTWPERHKNTPLGSSALSAPERKTYDTDLGGSIQRWKGPGCKLGSWVFLWHSPHPQCLSALSLAAPYPLPLNKSLRWICSMEICESFNYPNLWNLAIILSAHFTHFHECKNNPMTQLISVSILTKEKFLHFINTFTSTNAKFPK